MPLVFVWGFAYPMIKLVSASVSPIIISWVRVGVAAVFFLGVGRGLSVGLKQFVNGVLYFVFFMLLLNVGTSISSSPGLAAVMMYTQPVFVIVFERILGTRLTASTVIGVVIGFLGVFVSAASARFDLGILLTLLGGAVWALGTVYYARSLVKEDVLKLNAFMSISALPIVVALTPLDSRFVFSWDAVVLLLLLGVLAQALGYYLWFNAVRDLGSIKASAGSLVTPVVAYAASYLLVHSAPTIMEAVGSAITLIGVYLALSGKNQ